MAQLVGAVAGVDADSLAIAVIEPLVGQAFPEAGSMECPDNNDPRLIGAGTENA